MRPAESGEAEPGWWARGAAVYASIDPRLLHCKLWCWWLSASAACFYAFLPLVYASSGLSPSEIGILTGAAPIVSAFATASWAAWADTHSCHRSLLLLSVAGGAFLHCLLPFTPPKLGWLLPLVLLSEFVAAPCVALADAAIGLTLARAGLGFEAYGKQRLWGAVSWGFVFAPAIGAVEAFTSGRLRQAAPYVGHVLSSAGAFHAAAQLAFPAPPPPADKELQALKTEEGNAPAACEKADEEAEEVARGGLHALVHAVQRTSHHPGFLHRLYLFVALGAALGAMDVFLFVWLKELGGGTFLDGIALTVTCISETAIFFYAGEIESRLGTTGCLHVVLGCYVFRLFSYSLLGVFSSPWAVLPFQLLHGVTFGLLWHIGNSYMRAVAPHGLESTLQGLFQSLVQLGSFAGLLLAGALVQRAGCARMFGTFGGLMAAAQLLFYATDPAVAESKGGSPGAAEIIETGAEEEGARLTKD